MREGDLMVAVSFLVFLISVIAFVVYWWKKRRARIFAGEHYLADENYKIFERKLPDLFALFRS